MDIKLKNLLSEKKTAILQKWFDLILETYPPDTSNFLRSQKNRFANPVGSTISEGISGIFDGLVAGVKPADVSSFLDNIIRIRAIQDFTPSEAVAFVFQLKELLREELAEDNLSPEEWFILWSCIDKLALGAFDIYMGCRERLYEIKANEAKNRAFRLLERANMLSGVDEPDPVDGG